MTIQTGTPTGIGFSALRNDLSRPDARRRFCHYAARRKLRFEVADPAKSYDLVVSTVGGDLSAWTRLPPGTKLVLDFVDSYFAVPRADLKALGRGLAKFALGHTRHLHLDHRALLEAACRRADAVVCCTEAQRRQILPFCPNVHVILDFQPEAEWRVKTDYARGTVFNVVWEGLPQNVEHFAVIAGVLRDIQRREALAVHLVTDLERPRASLNFMPSPTHRFVRGALGLENTFLYQWNADTMSAIATRCDLAVIPLPLSDPFAAGKSENKLVLFWRMGVPALTSATPAYLRTMEAAGLDMTCRDSGDWARWIERMMKDEESRRDAGTRGRALTVREHGEARMLERWDAVFESARSKR